MIAATPAPSLSIHDFLAREAAKDLLRFSTAGSVDDGKSTLIGRLLYDTQSVYEDQVRELEGKGTTAPGQLDLALLTDGLRAEREQGITIDVAYRYFSTARRKFIIADTPGHEQYTRNMATGASTADAAVVLIDARKGVLVQSRRHAYIASLLGVRHVLVAVNKMDMAGWDERPFRAIEAEFGEVLGRIAADTGNPFEAEFIPLSALAGDNVVHRSGRMPWYRGGSLLELLEALPPEGEADQAPFRLPVQRVIRPDHSFRGLAGQIASGVVRPGDAITVLPSGQGARVSRIVTWDGDLPEASAPLSVTLVLDREIDIGRGDLLAAGAEPAMVAGRLRAPIVWMSRQALDPGRRYLVKHASQAVAARVASIDSSIDVTTLERQPAGSLELNQIGTITLELMRPIACDPYARNRATGGFILIDPADNSTVAAGMIAAVLPSGPEPAAPGEGIAPGPVTAGERAARWGHRGGVLELRGPRRSIDAVERSLFARGAVTARVDGGDRRLLSDPGLLEPLLAIAAESGVITLLVHPGEGSTLTARAAGRTVTAPAEDPGSAVGEVLRLLEGAGVLVHGEREGVLS